jgi:hypothetical protein
MIVKVPFMTHSPVKGFGKAFRVAKNTHFILAKNKSGGWHSHPRPQNCWYIVSWILKKNLVFCWNSVKYKKKTQEFKMGVVLSERADTLRKFGVLLEVRQVEEEIYWRDKMGVVRSYGKWRITPKKRSWSVGSPSPYFDPQRRKIEKRGFD